MINKIREKEAPTHIDKISLVVDDISIDVYGILHGVFGGANKDYVNAVNRTIEQSKGVRYCENSMSKLYEGLGDGLGIDLHDWLSLTNREVFNFSFRTLISPRFWGSIFRAGYHEKFSKPSFGEDGIYTIPDAASSTHFHLLDPEERRLVCGLPDAEEYLKLNIMRREGKADKRFRFPDKNWIWLEVAEPYACIPLRSAHMIESVIFHAKKNNHKEISLFVGEIHNTDIKYWCGIRNDKNHWAYSYIKDVQKISHHWIENPSYLFRKKICYFLFSLLGGTLAILPYLIAVNYFFATEAF